jgi:hypothetical protein
MDMRILKDIVKMKALAIHTVPIHVFHDVHKTLELLEKEVCSLS